jgi:L-threonylcarbamoyladenylate synthase
VRRIRIADLLASPAEREEFSRILRAGGLAAIPTETFYGLAADPHSEAGVRRALAMKGRETAKPLLVLFAERSQLDGLGILAAAEIVAHFFALWPAPLTAIFGLREPIPASLGRATLGVRMPAHDALHALLARVGPVTGTSLNRSGDPPCETAEQVAERFAGEIDLLVDGGKTSGGLPSTLVDATVDPPRVLRAGAFAWPPASA